MMRWRRLCSTGPNLLASDIALSCFHAPWTSLFTSSAPVERLLGRFCTLDRSQVQVGRTITTVDVVLLYWCRVRISPSTTTPHSTIHQQTRRLNDCHCKGGKIPVVAPRYATPVLTSILDVTPPYSRLTRLSRSLGYSNRDRE